MLGCKERGRQRDGPLNHVTGKGWIKQVKGHYHDALYVKKSRVVVWLVETTGGVCPHACAHGRRLAERARTRCVWGPSCFNFCLQPWRPASQFLSGARIFAKFQRADF